LHLPPYFRAWAIQCHSNFSPGDLCCHGNVIRDKIDYNSVCVRDICIIYNLPVLICISLVAVASLLFAAVQMCDRYCG